MSFEVGSKTFLIGEYAALRGGPALLVSTAPRFQLYAKEQKPTLKENQTQFQLKDIAEESPAGRFLKTQSQSVKDMWFVDPHHGRGGFGASSAQFVLAYAAVHPAALDSNGVVTHAWLFDMWKAFRAVASDKGVTPSGLDVLSQTLGGLSMMDIKVEHVKSFYWTIDNLDFLLVRTGMKVATHEHLYNLGPWNNDQQLEMEDLVRTCIRGFEINSIHEVVGSVKQYAALLERLNFVHINARNLMTDLNKHPGVLATKGCGALGADVVLALVEKAQLENVKKLIHEELKYEIVGSSADLSAGLEIKNEQ